MYVQLARMAMEVVEESRSLITEESEAEGRTDRQTHCRIDEGHADYTTFC